MPKDFGYQNIIASEPQYDHDIILMEDAEGTDVWTASGTGADFVNSFTTAAAYFGLKGWDIRTRATTPAANDYVSVTRKLTYPRTPRLVLRCRLQIPDVSDVKYVTLEILIYDGTNYYSAAICITPNTPKVEYNNPELGATEIPALAFVWNDNDWVTIEFGVNMITKTYLGIWFNGASLAEGGYAIQNIGASTRRGISALIYVKALGAFQAQVNIDSLYIGSALDL